MRFSHCWIKLSIALLLINTSIKTLIAASNGETVISRLLEKYKENDDIDELCDDLEKAFGTACVDHVDNADQKRLLKYSREKDYPKAIAIIRDNLFVKDERLELGIRCQEIKDSIAVSDDAEVPDILMAELPPRFNFIQKKARSDKTIKDRATRVRESSSCNLEALLSYYGKVEPDHYIVGAAHYLKDQVVKMIPTIPKRIPGFTKENPLDEFDKEYERRRKESEMREKTARETLEKVYQEEYACFKNKDPHCESGIRKTEEYILTNLGKAALNLARANPNLRYPTFQAAKVYSYVSNIDYFGKLDAFGFLVEVMTKHPLVTLILVIIATLYRTELIRFLSVAIIGTGFGWIPMFWSASRYLDAIFKRLGGIAVTVLLGAIGFGYHYDVIGKEAAFLSLYCIVSAYANIAGSPGPKTALITVMPLAIWIGAQNIQIPTIIIPARSSWIEMPQISISDLMQHKMPGFFSILAIASAMVIYILAAYCDTLGKATYDDVKNWASRSRVTPEPTPSPDIFAFITGSISTNVIIILGCIAIPGLFNLSTWPMVSLVALLSMVTAAVMYQYCYHEEYVREGKNTGSTVGRVIDSMNVIAGHAPKNVLLSKFQTHVQILLVAMAFFTGCRHSIYVGAGLGVILAASVSRLETKLDLSVNWAVGTSIAICGTIPHLIIGIIYILCKVGRHLKIPVKNLVRGETFREVTT